MASNVIKGSVRSAITRNYAAQAAVATKQNSYSLPHHQPEVSTLPQGGVVASLENNSPVSRIAIFVKSGSRYETCSNLGLSQVLRLSAGLSCKNISTFGITRKTQQIGGTLIAQNGREHMSYEMAFLRGNLKEGFDILSDVVVNPTFKPWEVNTLVGRLRYELGTRTHSVLAIEMLHKAAFRSSGLGNSLFVPNHHIGKVTPEQLHEFVKHTYINNRLAFIGLGVEHKDLVKLAKLVSGSTGTELQSASTTYGGGEVRVETGGSLAHVALAGPGAKIGGEDAASLAIAQFILGGHPGTKYGSNASSKLASLIVSAGGQGSAVPLNANYTDAGLFGFYLVEEASKVGEVVKAIAKGIRTLKISEADVQNAKAKTKAAILLAAESTESELEEMGLQTLFTGKYSTPSDLAAAVDKVTAASVQSALSNATKGKPSLGAIGAIARVPYIDQL